MSIIIEPDIPIKSFGERMGEGFAHPPVPKQ
jgi:hypothetical protein